MIKTYSIHMIKKNEGEKSAFSDIFHQKCIEFLFMKYGTDEILC